MLYKLTLTFHSDKDHWPLVIQVGVPEEVAKVLMGQPLTSITARLDGKPQLLGDTKYPLLYAKGEKSL